MNPLKMRLVEVTAVVITVASVCLAGGAQQPLRLAQSIPLPMLHDGDFDHFTADLQSNWLFSAAEENSEVLVFNLKTGQLIPYAH